MEQWEQGLREVVGLDEAEIVVLRSALLDFCDAHAVTPAELLDRWTGFPELTAARGPRAGRRPRLVVESFLAHHGVNLFRG